MKKSTGKRPFPVRALGLFVLILLLSLEILYLISVNLIINTSIGERLVNRKPEKMMVHWKSGSSLYPGDLTLNGFNMRVQKNFNQWFLSMDRADGHVAIAALLKREFRLTNLRAEGVSFQFKRHKEPFPEPPGKRRKWVVSIEEAEVLSINELMIQDTYLQGSGTASGSLSLVTRGEMIIYPTVIKIEDATLSREGTPLANNLSIDMAYHTDPFTPSIEKGRKALKYMTSEIQATGILTEFQTPKTFFKKLSWLQIKESGKFAAKIHFEKGSFKAGSRIGIMETDILARYKELQVEGVGSLSIVLPEHTEDIEEVKQADLDIGFDQYRLTRDGIDAPLVRGDGFNILVENAAFDVNQPFSGLDVTVDLPPSSVPDVRVFNSYLGEDHAIKFTGGEASVTGHMQYIGGVKEGGGWIAFSSDQVELNMKEDSFSGSFMLRTHFSEFRPGASRIVFTGSSVKMANPEKKWEFNAVLTNGLLKWSEKALKRGGKKILKTANGDFKLQAEVSDIGFINRHIQGYYGFKINGKGNLAGDMKIAQGNLAPGTSFEFDVPEISASLLGYTANGRAILRGNITENKRSQSVNSASIDLVITDYRVSREGMNRYHSGGKSMTASIRIPEFKLEKKRPMVEMQIHMPENIISDMSSYNHLWGEKAAFQIESGRGTSHGRLFFSSRTESMEGEIVLNAKSLKARFEDLPISADFHFTGKLVSKDVKNMVFSLAGSKILLDHVVTGQQQPEENWQMNSTFKETRLTWQQPMLISGTMDLEMTDTAPFVAVFSERKQMLKPFSRILNIRNISGTSEFDLNKNYFDIPSMEILGEGLQMLGKSRMNRHFKRGALFIHFKKVPFLVTLEGEKKRPHFIRPLQQFHSFDVFIDP